MKARLAKSAAAVLLLGALVGYAAIEFQADERKAAVVDGDGGTKLTVDGVDFWANGTPPRKYKVVGVVKAEIGDGVGADSMIRSRVAMQVKEAGGDAAILVDERSQGAGARTTSYLALGNAGRVDTSSVPERAVMIRAKSAQFTVVKYL